MSLKTRVWRLLGKFDRRLVLVEDTVDEIRGVVHDVLAVVTELRAEMRSSTSRIEAAVVEQGKTLGSAYAAMADERERRGGLGQELMRLSGRIDALERGPRGAGAAE